MHIIYVLFVIILSLCLTLKKLCTAHIEAYADAYPCFLFFCLLFKHLSVHPDRGYGSVRTGVHTNLWDIRWPQQPQSKICPYIRWPLGPPVFTSPLHGILPKNGPSIFLRLFLHLHYQDFCQCHYRLKHRHHINIPPSNASFIRCKCHNRHRNFCATSRFQYYLTRRFWFDSYFLIQFESTFPIKFDSDHRSDSTNTAYIWTAISDLNQILLINFTQNLFFGSTQFSVLIQPPL